MTSSLICFALCFAGDKVTLALPMSIRAERVQDDRPEYSSQHVSIVNFNSTFIYIPALLHPDDYASS